MGRLLAFDLALVGYNELGMSANSLFALGRFIEEPIVSIIIVSWNARSYLAQCLESLHATEKCSVEIFVVDNCSSDGSPEMVAQDYPNVRLIRNTSNLGFARANNLGIQASRGQYICLVNSDVRVLPNCIAQLLDYLTTHPDVGMVGPRVMGGDGKLQRSCRGFPSLWNMFCRALALDAILPNVRVFGGYLLSYWKQDTTKSVDILSGCFWLVKKESLDDVGLLDETFFMYGEDMDWCKRFNAAGWKTVFIPDAQIIHYGGGSSANAPVRFFIEQQRADLFYWEKHHGTGMRTCYYLICCIHQFLRVIGHSLMRCLPHSSKAVQRAKILRSLNCFRWLLTRTAFPREPVQSDTNEIGIYVG